MLGVNHAQANQKPLRIYPDTLRAYTPEEAVKGFIEAYKRDDFYEVWHRFTGSARKGYMERLVTTFCFNGFFNLKNDTFIMNLPGARFYDDGILNTLSDDEKYDFSDYGLLFDDAMLAARKLHILPFTFGPGSAILTSKKKDDFAYLEINTDSKPPIITIVAKKISSNGLWRIDQVMWPDSADNVHPWGYKDDYSESLSKNMDKK